MADSDGNTVVIRHVAGAAAATRRTELGKRTLAALVAATIALVALWSGGVAFWLLIALGGAVVVGEWAGLMHASQGRIRLAIGVFGLVALSFSPFAFGPDRNGAAMVVLGAILVTLVGGSARLGAGLVYSGLASVALLFLREQAHGVALTLWTLLVVWGTDSGAYFAGRAIGGPKLAPRLSPNKTWAGLVGGALTALIVGAAVALIGNLPAAFLGLGGVMAVLAQAGDLYESWLKRKVGVKDSGRLLPGHGGAFDRFDGLMPVAIVIGALVSNGTL